MNVDVINMNDDELYAVMKKYLFTAVVGDIMDAMNLRNQFLPPGIQALKDDYILVGRAMTVQESNCTGTTIASQKIEKPFGLMFEALDSLQKNDVYLCTGASPKYACFGALMATRALAVGAVGAVIEGFVRDVRELNKMDFPIFSTGKYARDQGVRGRVIDFNCPIEFSNSVVVHPGDIVFGDIDGVVIIPKGIEREVIKLALEKVMGENKVKQALESGMSSAQAFSEFGIM